MTSFALMTSDELNARLTGILATLEERAEFHPICTRDLLDEARCLQKMLNRRYSLNVDLDAVLRDLDAAVHMDDAPPMTEH